MKAAFKGAFFLYGKKAKVIGVIIQGLLAGLLVFLLTGLSRWTVGNLSIGEMGQRFENTTLFLETVEEIVRDKVSYDMNLELFEQEGDFQEHKKIDTRQYTTGSLDESTANPGTTYELKDLLSFSIEGEKVLSGVIRELMASEGSMEAAGMALSQVLAEYETILPVSGQSLSSLAENGTGSGAALLENCRNLCETAADIGLRYEQYLKDAGSDVSRAPSNVGYYVENTADRHAYTNLGAASLTQAQEAVVKAGRMAFLFEGERRLNIMVTNNEHVFSDRAAEWFMKARFTGTGEIVFIAVDMSYQADDSLRSEYRLFQKRGPLMTATMILITMALLLLLALFIISVITAGKGEKGSVLPVTGFDQIPTEVAALLGIAAAVTWWRLSVYLFRPYGFLYCPASLVRPLRTAVEYIILMVFFLSIVRRIKTASVWNNSVTCYVILGMRQVYSARKSFQRVLILYVGFIIMNMLCLIVGSVPGAVMAVILNLSALLYLTRNAVGNRNVMEGLEQISKGDLNYRVNTEALTGESREMGMAVNEMGEGLGKAVSAMISNERLKAELITNVSHDLKTPLTSIINYVDLLGRSLPRDGSEEAREYLKILEQKTSRLRQLTEDLIEASRISSGNIEVHPAHLALDQLTMQAVGEFEDRFSKRALKIDLSLPGKPVFIEADGALLWRVFENLLGNIVKYAAEASEVQAKLTVDEENALVSFVNHTPEPITSTEEELMERFGRGDKSRRTEGSGLGLSIAKNLTELMGGVFTIKVSGSRFEARVGFPVRKIDTVS